MQKIRVMIVSAREASARSLKTILDHDESFDAFWHPFSSLREALEAAQGSQPDIVLFDLEPAEAHYDSTRRLKNLCPSTLVIALAENGAAGKTIRAVAAGADGCLSRDMLPCHLLMALRLVYREKVLFFPGNPLLKEFLRDTNGCKVPAPERSSPQRSHEPPGDPGAAGGETAGSQFPLTQREKEVYRLLTLNYSNKDIARTLYISEPTVKSHVSSILRKLGLQNRREVILHAAREGNLESGPVQ